MTSVCAYRRPASLDEALLLLSSPGTVVLGGGTRLATAPAPGPVRVVDLQALGLAGIEALNDARTRVGAMATLQQMADSTALPAVVREAARRERPSTLRSQATLGGCVAAREADSELLAALLVHDAVLTVAGHDGPVSLGLAEFLAGHPLAGARIVTDVTIGTSGMASAVRAGRTGADRPIVAALARVTADGQQRLAVTGVAPAPVLLPGPGAAAGLDPLGDFRGSGEYRRGLAAVLAARALEAIS